MVLKTTGLKKRKKKGPPSLAKKPPKYWTGKPVGPGRPKKPPVGVKPGPGKPIKGPKKPGPGKPPKKPGPGKPKPRPPTKRPGPAPKGTKPGKPNFGGYVSRHADLAKAFKKHKAKGGTGTAAEWGKKHYEKYGKKEKRKLS
jgi:hypothetical protein